MKKLLTRILTVIAGVSTLLALVSCDKLFSPTEKPVEIPEQRLEQLNQTFRSAVASAMQQAAELANVQVQTDNFAAILPDDGSSVVVNAVVAGAENLTLEQLARGADVLFTFLQLPRGSALPSGFYTVRLFQMETRWKAQFKDLQGKVVLETDAEVKGEDPALRLKDGVTSVIIIQTENVIIVILDIHPLQYPPPWSARVMLRLGTGGPDSSSLPTAGQAILQAMGKFYQEARRVMNTIETNTFQQVMVGTRNDVLLVHTVFQGVEKLTLEELAKGQDVFLRYIHYSPPHPMMPTGFAVVRILRNSAGQWAAQIRDLQGKLLLELPVSVEPQTNVGGVSLTLGISEDTEYGVVLPQGIRINIVYKDREHGAYGDLETPEQKLKKAQEEFRSTVVSEMQKAAAEAGIKVRTDNYIALPVDDSTVFVNTMVEGYDQLTIEQLTRGVDAMFIFSSATLSAGGREIEPGFYVVRLSQNPAGEWIAQFKNMEGRVVLETEAAVEQADPSAAKMQPMCTLGPRGELILFDAHDPLKDTYVEVSFHSGRRGVPYLLVDHGKVLRQAARDYLLSQDLPQDLMQELRQGSWVLLLVGPLPRPADWIVTQCKVGGKKIWCDCYLRWHSQHVSVWRCSTLDGDFLAEYIYIRE